MYTHQEAFLPILRLLTHGQEQKRHEIADGVADYFDLSADEREEMLPSGKTQTYRSRTGWGLTFLQKAGLVDRPRRGVYTITESGYEIAKSELDSISTEFLRTNFPAFETWVQQCRSSRKTIRNENEEGGHELSSSEMEISDATPEEALERAHAALRADLADEILDTIKEHDPEFFERLVVRLLVKMGYGGSFADAAHSVGRSGDGGIDGIIKEDRLGLDAIYIQAKRYQDKNSVGRPAVQAFVGAITGHRAKKGVFLTTSSFTREAAEYVKNLDKTVVLIDGPRLAELMIEFNLGVTLEQTYEIKRIDSDFFEA